VEPTDSCEYFLDNPAEGHFVTGVAADVNDQLSTAIDELEKAIALGLPEDTEMQARYFLGGAYRQVAGRAGLPAGQMARTAEFARAWSEQEKAVRMDRDGAYGYFAQPTGRALLGSFDLACALRGNMIAEEQGQQAAIAFLEERVQLCDHLSTSPLLTTLLNLGALYYESGATDRAATCYERVVQAEPVDRIDEKGLEAETRTMAASNLRILKGQGPAAPSTGSGCMLIVTVLGLILFGAWSSWISP